MIQDPVIDEICKYVLRMLYFFLLSIGFAFLTFVKTMSSSLESTFAVLPPSLVLACAPSQADFMLRIAFLALAAGILVTIIIFMLFEQWWDRRSELPRRGARLDAERDQE